MKSVVGLLEYTVTGAFVWVLVAIFAAWIGFDAQLGASPLASVPALPQELVASSTLMKDVISLAIGGAFLVAVFATGALLDLVAPVVFIVLEIGWAQKWIFNRPQDWLDRLVREEGGFVAADYEILVRNRGQKKPVIWAPLRYRRVTAFLLSYVLAGAKAAQVEDLVDRWKLWRVNQAICLSLLMLTFALCGWTLFTYDANMSVKSVLAGVLLPIVLSVLSYVSMRLSFFRLVTSFEPALYLTFMQSRRKPDEPAQLAPAVPAGTRSAIAGRRAARAFP
jgi:hypothetical protein